MDKLMAEDATSSVAISYIWHRLRSHAGRTRGGGINEGLDLRQHFNLQLGSE